MDYKKELEELIEIVVREGGSDIHFSEGMHPTIRVSGFLVPINKKAVLTKGDTLGFITELLNREKKELFLKEQETDFSYAYGDKARFRGNAFFQKGSIGIALRLIPTVIKTIQDLHLPPILETFTKKQQGFFLVVGPVGQGKTTTLASMVEMINNDRPEHIITIEDPIEFIYEPKKCLIDQREVHIDTKDFHIALQSIFRQDIDVLMVGEMRGLETISTAVTAAETGHLVLSTLHTNNAAQTIDRIIDSFPPDQQDQIRTQLSESMSGIFSQRLIPRISGGLIPAYELLVNTSAVANLIREKRTHEINTVIETGLEEGMIDMNRCLADLVRAGEISVENAYLRSFNPKTLQKLL
ncbi:MAG: PilT/PilU family type 4a pilus ATPase [Candidatus Pacebacteria bacterium]|nr:PilT/PilU family type 4a pilus ATPase [Candidatus Paceibacterota bacterium]